MKRYLPIIAAIALASPVAGPVAADHEMENRNLDQGRALYAEQCAACHGAKLEGEPNWRQPNEDGSLPAPPHDVSGHTWHHDNKMLFDYVQLGGQTALEARGIKDFKSAMPAFGDALSEDEIWAILAFIRSTWPDRAREIQASRNPPHS